jgi:hypothetical protein
MKRVGTAATATQLRAAEPARRVREMVRRHVVPPGSVFTPDQLKELRHVLRDAFDSVAPALADVVQYEHSTDRDALRAEMRDDEQLDREALPKARRLQRRISRVLRALDDLNDDDWNGFLCAAWNVLPDRRLHTPRRTDEPDLAHVDRCMKVAAQQLATMRTSLESLLAVTEDWRHTLEPCAGRPGPQTGRGPLEDEVVTVLIHCATPIRLTKSRDGVLARTLAICYDAAGYRVPDDMFHVVNRLLENPMVRSWIGKPARPGSGPLFE